MQDIHSPMLVDSEGLIAETMKLLALKHDETIFEHLDIDDDAIFLDPMLFAFFNNSHRNYDLRSVLGGYGDGAESRTIAARTNSRGVAYIPNIGYFATTIPEQKVNITYLNPESFTVELDGQALRAEYHPISIIPGSTLEHLTENVPLLDNLFKIYVFDGENTEVAYVDVHETSRDHHQHLCTAYDLMDRYCPEFTREFDRTNRKVLTFSNPKVISFVTFSVHGMIFLSCNHENNELFFLEEMIHQGSHNFLNSVMRNKSDFFKIDVENEPLSKYVNNPNEYRTIYSALHGLYTVAKRVELFDVFYSANVFQGRNKHELIGRYCDQFRRFRTGLQKIDPDEIYTPLGKEFYLDIDRKCAETLALRRHLYDEFSVVNQPQEFSYHKFCIDNPFEQFVLREEKAITRKK